MKRTSIKDIARVVGVSTATVSLVLSNKGNNGRVSEERIKKIRSVAKEMNYQPNRLARSLKSGSTQIISLLLTDIVNPFFGSLAYHIQNELAKAGYAVIITNTDEDNRQMEKMINLMRSQQVDGFIIIPAEFGEESIRQLVDHKVPLVLIDRYYPDIPTNNVLIDNHDASYQATRYMIEKQCRRIALLIYDNNQPHMLDRKNGYIEALKEAGLFSEKLIKEVTHKDISENVRQVIAELTSGDDRIDGILLASNTIAVNGIKQLLKRHIRIPDDIQMVCFDKSDVFEVMPTAIPYIQQPIQSMAKMATSLLIEQINTSNTSNVSSYRLPSELII
jgi:LacI family transcriptional regulator